MTRGSRFGTVLAVVLVVVAGAVAPVDVLSVPAAAAEAGSAPCTQTVGS